MGKCCHYRALGFGATRGRLYMKHPEVFKVRPWCWQDVTCSNTSWISGQYFMINSLKDKVESLKIQWLWCQMCKICDFPTKLGGKSQRNCNLSLNALKKTNKTNRSLLIQCIPEYLGFPMHLIALMCVGLCLFFQNVKQTEYNWPWGWRGTCLI